MNGQLPLQTETENQYISRNNKQSVKIAIYDARNATFVYTSIHVHVPTLFSI